ncbi:MAG TPA: NUMOD4 domain-containing protein [Pseudonocardia sp.]
MTEIWNPIPGYEGIYEASSDGRVRSLDRDVAYSNGRQRTHRSVVLKGRPDEDGYLRVTLWRDRKSKLVGIHRLVCLAFYGEPPTGANHAAHRDGDHRNNAAGNLYWATPVQNEADKLRHGRRPDKSQSHCANGHELSPENTYVNARGRQCRLCKIRNSVEWQQANRERRREINRAYRARKKAAAK